MQIATTKGDIIIELLGDVAPVSVMHFIDHVESGYYEDTIFHRVTDSVIQGGGFTADLVEKTTGQGKAIAEESRRGWTNSKGTVAYVRNPLLRISAKTQFFINLKDSPQRDQVRDQWGYTVFGRVVEGFDTVERIAAVPVSTHPRYAEGRCAVVPVAPVVMKSARLLTPLDRPSATAVAEEYRAKMEDPVGYRVRELEGQLGAKAEGMEEGLTYIDEKVGGGAFPVPGDTVEINFRGELVNGTEIDSSIQRWEGPGKVKLDTLLSGLRMGVAGMREGGIRWLVVPPHLGFGELGKPPFVGPDTTLFFRVELLGVSRDEPQP